MKLSEVKISETFSIADIEFIKFAEKDGVTVAVTKNTLFNEEYGKNNNFAESEILRRLEKEVLPKIEKVVGVENVLEFETDLLSLDGLDTYGKINSKISLPTFDFYRNNVRVFDKHTPKTWWWLSTPDTTPEHRNDCWAVCVSPGGDVNGNGCDDGGGVRPFCILKSNIFVSK